jgi:hypothetical protein
MKVNGQKVLIHSLGDGKEGKGTVRGLAVVTSINLYIVELEKPHTWECDYDCVVFPESCLTDL